MMKKIMWTVSFLSLVLTAFALSFMPDRVPMHYDAAGNIDRWGSKYESLIFPVLILCMAVFWTLLLRCYEKKARNAADEKERAGAKSNVKVFGITGACMAVMFTVMQCFMMYGSYQDAVSMAAVQSVDIGRVMVILMGVMFIILGNFMPKTRINGALGVRVSWSMYNDNTWRKSNHFGGIAIMVAGILSILTGVFIKNSLAAVMTELVYLLAAAALTVWYAHKVYNKEIETEKEENDGTL